LRPQELDLSSEIAKPAQALLSEQQIQRDIFQHLRARAVPGATFWHPFSGGFRRPKEAAIFKRLGAIAGLPDVMHSSSRARFWPPAMAQGHKCPPAGFCRLLRPGRILCPSRAMRTFFSRYQHNDRWDCHGDEVPKPKPVFAILDIRAELLRRPRRDPPRARTAQADLHLEGGRPCEGQRLRWPVSQPCSVTGRRQS
jgi:hypothetical protein